MFPKVMPRHHNLAGTVSYLFSLKGEHTDPHLVAAWDTALLEGELARPDKAGRRRLVDLLDAPRVLHGVDLAAGHVYHVPIAVPSADGRLGDARWRELVESAIADLGLGPTASFAGCRWIAVHHGLSANGNDHVHLVVQLVGEDGTVPRLSFDKRRWRAWAQAVEDRLYLTRTGREGTGARSLTRAEVERAQRTSVEPERRRLARAVRAAAASSADEFGFVQVARDNGVRLQARVDRGRVVGYSASVQPVPGEPELRLPGGQLARDLSLSRLRERWATPTDLQARALPLWWSAPDPSPAQGSRLMWISTRRRLDEATRQVRQLDPDNREQWNAAIDQIADVVAVLAIRLEPNGAGDLHRAGDALVAAARLGRPSGPRRPRQVVLPTLAEAARFIAYSADPAAAVAIVVMVAIAMLVWTLATRQRYDQYPGESGAYLHRADDRLARYRSTDASQDGQGLVNGQNLPSLPSALSTRRTLPAQGATRPSRAVRSSPPVQPTQHRRR